MKQLACLVIFQLLCFVGLAQTCLPPLQWTPVQRNNVIEWEKFPEFSLPFTVIYEGPRFGDTQSSPLKRGFSHLATFSGSEGATLPISQRAITWYHVATDANTQPWAERNLESPWDNDLNLYRSTWDTQLRGLSNTFNDSRGSSRPQYDIIALDIERIHDTDREILTIKNNMRVPAAIRTLPDAQFIERYKRDMQRLYATPIDYLRTQNIGTTKIGSYSDAIVRGNFNNWLGMTLTSWKDWSSDRNSILHVMRDTLTGNVGGAFYKNLDLLTPSCYYYYDYNTNPLGRDYLAYMLFVIEANRAWSDKPVIPYVWLRYHDAFNPTIPFVPPFVAEATAIFPFFSGAKGLWLWEGPVESRQDNYAVYEHFIHGLYRLSQFKDFFVGDHQLVIPQAAVESAKTKTPIWRGVVKGNEILIAAQNPYATSDAQMTEVTVQHRNWQQTIVLRGREVYLCKFDFGTLASVNNLALINSFSVKPNPFHTQCEYSFDSPRTGTAQVQVIDLMGRVCHQEEVSVIRGNQTKQLQARHLSNGLYLLTITIDNTQLSTRIMMMK